MGIEGRYRYIWSDIFLIRYFIGLLCLFSNLDNFILSIRKNLILFSIIRVIYEIRRCKYEDIVRVWVVKYFWVF